MFLSVTKWIYLQFGAGRNKIFARAFYTFPVYNTARQKARQKGRKTALFRILFYFFAAQLPVAVRNSVQTRVWVSSASAEMFSIISVLSLNSSGSVRNDLYSSLMYSSAALFVQ